MSKALAPRLDPKLAACPVDEEGLLEESMRAWFFTPDALMAALVGLQVADVKPGASRDRKKAQTAALLRIATGDLDEPALEAVTAALDLKPRDLGKRGGTDVDWLDDQPAVFVQYESGPVQLGGEEVVALRVIADVAAHGPRRANKLAVIDVLRWHAQQDRLPTALAVNALAAVVGFDKKNDPLLSEAGYIGEALYDQMDDETVRLARLIGYAALRRLAADAEPFTVRVDNGADPDVLLTTPTSDIGWARLASLTGLAMAELIALAGEKAEPLVRPLLKASGTAKQTAADQRNHPRFEALENAELRRLGEAERTAQQLRAMRSDAFAEKTSLNHVLASSSDLLTYGPNDEPATAEQRAEHEAALVRELQWTKEEVQAAKARLRAKAGVTAEQLESYRGSTATEEAEPNHAADRRGRSVRPDASVRLAR